MNETRCREIVKERAGGKCEVCGYAGRGLSLHHRWKRSQGGPWTPENCLHVCGDGVRYCHGWIEANPLAANRAGWWLTAGEVPGDAPVWLTIPYGSGWFRLLDWGGYEWVHGMGDIAEYPPWLVVPLRQPG